MDAFLPRPYQQNCIDAVLTRHAEEESRTVIELPPGAGKTLISGALLKEALHPKEYGLFVVPWLHLVEQTYKVLTKYFFSPWEVGIVQGSTNQVGRHITVASADTLRQPGRLEQLLEAQHKRLISGAVYDECHRSFSDTYRHIDTALSPYALKVGPSATPYRGDGQSLLPVFPDGLSYSISFFDLIALEYLCDVHSYDVEIPLELTPEEVEGLDDEQNIKKLSPATRAKLRDLSRYRRTYEVWQEMTGGKQRTLIFAQDLDDAFEFAKYFQEQGVASQTITGKMGPDRRKEIYRLFKSGEAPVLLNYDVLSTGADFPEIECIVIGRLMSLGHWIQSVGRGLRLCPEIGKTRCLLLNLVDRHHTLMTMGRLIGIESDTIPSLKKTMKEKVEEEEEEETVVIEDREEARPFALSVKVAEVRAKAYNVLCGDGWQVNEVTGDFTKDCGTLGSLVALRTFVGYSVKHISKGGQIRWLSRDPIDAFKARAMAHEYIMRKRLAGEKRTRGGDPTKPISEGQWQHLRQRHVSGIGKTYEEGLATGLKESHYYQIDAHLRQWGAVYSKEGGRISYRPTTQRVYVSPSRK